MKKDAYTQALDAALELTAEFEKRICENPVVSGSKGLAEMADKIGDALGDLYQSIGNVEP